MKMTFPLLLFTSIKVLNSSPTWKCQKCCVPKAPQNQLSTQFAQVRVRYSLQCIGLSPYRSSSISLVMNANCPTLTWSLMFVFLKAKRHMVLTKERYETCLELALNLLCQAPTPLSPGTLKPPPLKPFAASGDLHGSAAVDPGGGGGGGSPSPGCLPHFPPGKR